MLLLKLSLCDEEWSEFVVRRDTVFGAEEIEIETR